MILIFKTVFDSIGKPSSGVMEGLTFLGLYSECIDIKNHLFNGQYCLATVNLPKNTMFQRYFGKREVVSSDLQAKIGICVPSTCSVDEIKSFTNRGKFLYFFERDQ